MTCCLYNTKRDFQKENIYVFDRGYIDYEFYERLNKGQIGFVTRLKDNASYQAKEELLISDDDPDALLKDELMNYPFVRMVI